MTRSQEAFELCWKSDKKNSSFPLMLLEMSGQELKWMDVRPNEKLGKENEETGELNYEMFWTGELEELDQVSFKDAAAKVLADFGANINGDMRECGCMISMVALPFRITEENAMELGRAMFDDFGEIREEDEEKTAKKHEAHKDDSEGHVASAQ